MRTTTAELFPAVSVSDTLSLRALLERTRAEPLPTPVALALSAEVAQRVGAVHATGRLVGAFDASRVRVNRSGMVTLARTGGGALAPELQEGGLPSVQSDVWALAHVIYEALTGRAPVKDGARGGYAPPSAFNPRVDEELDGVVLAALKHEPGERPASALALQVALEAWLEENAGEGASSALVERLRGVFGPVELAAKKPRPITLEVPLARTGDVVDLTHDTETITELIRRAGPDEPPEERVSAGFMFNFEVTVEPKYVPVADLLKAALPARARPSAPPKARATPAPPRVVEPEPEQPVTEQVRTGSPTSELEAAWLASPGAELLSDDEARAAVRRPRWRTAIGLGAAALVALMLATAVLQTSSPVPVPAPIAEREEEELAPPPAERSSVVAEAPREMPATPVVGVAPPREPVKRVVIAKRSPAKTSARSRR